MTNLKPIMVVATNRPSMKANKHTFHLAVGGKTFCGRDASEWMRMKEMDDHDLNSSWLCRACYAKATAA